MNWATYRWRSQRKKIELIHAGVFLSPLISEYIRVWSFRLDQPSRRNIPAPRNVDL